jgi:Ni/Co efflux regulator RcnB
MFLNILLSILVLAVLVASLASAANTIIDMRTTLRGRESDKERDERWQIKREKKRWREEIKRREKLEKRLIRLRQTSDAAGPDEKKGEKEHDRL